MSEYSDEINKLVAEGLHCRAIAKQLDVSPGSLSYYLKVNNIQVLDGKNTIMTDIPLMEEIKKLHTEGFTYVEIGNALTINPKSVCKVVGKLGLPRRTPLESLRNNYTVDETAFTKDNAETAYWLGWLITDGCLTDNNAISIGLKAEDGYIVEKLKEFVGSTAKCHYIEYFHKQMQRNVRQVSFSITSEVLASNLKRHNVTPRKSCKEQPPNIDWLYGEHASVFWRACIEGDGYISKNYKQPCISFVGGVALLSAFREYCEKVCGVKVGKRLAALKKDNPDFLRIEYTGPDSRKIMRKLWSQGDIFLKRKQERVQAVIEHWKHETQ